MHVQTSVSDFGEAVIAGPAPGTIEDWLLAWLLPEAEPVSATGSRSPAMSGSISQNRPCLAAARLLHWLADLLVTPVPGRTSCSRDGRLPGERRPL